MRFCHLLILEKHLSEREGVEFDQKIHFYLAEGLLRTIAVQSDRKSSCTETRYSFLTCGLAGELRKTVVALLSKLYLPEEVETAPLQAMVVLMRNIISVSRSAVLTCWSVLII